MQTCGKPSTYIGFFGYLQGIFNKQKYSNRYVVDMQ